MPCQFSLLKMFALCVKNTKQPGSKTLRFTDSNQICFSRSKYKTLLHELAVSENPPLVFNSSMKPQTLRQAICMYIDYLTLLNENRVRVAEFNSEPLMEPGFDCEDYYHEVIIALTDVDKFFTWVRELIWAQHGVIRFNKN